MTAAPEFSNDGGVDAGRFREFSAVSIGVRRECPLGPPWPNRARRFSGSPFPHHLHPWARRLRPPPGRSAA
jgi:hypothetical protein